MAIDLNKYHTSEERTKDLSTGSGVSLEMRSASSSNEEILYYRTRISMLKSSENNPHVNHHECAEKENFSRTLPIKMSPSIMAQLDRWTFN